MAKAIANGLANVTASSFLDDDKRPAENSWYEAAAFVNWLNTSKGYQAAYNLVHSNGAWSMQLWESTNAWTLGGINLYRHKNAHFFMPSENEWYKAAYYDPTSSKYFDYATGSDYAPSPLSSGSNTGTAVYLQSIHTGPADTQRAGGPSPYGTIGQGGNANEMTETAFDGLNDSPSEARVLRGGNYMDNAEKLRSLSRGNALPSLKQFSLGFRVASIANFTLDDSFGSGTNMFTIDFVTVADAGNLPDTSPVITSLTYAFGTVGTPFSYTITADNSPTSFTAEGLPAGLSIDTATGVISGTPTQGSGVFIGQQIPFLVSLSASNSVGTGTGSLELYVDWPPISIAMEVQVEATLPPNHIFFTGESVSLRITHSFVNISPDAVSWISYNINVTGGEFFYYPWGYQGDQSISVDFPVSGSYQVAAGGSYIYTHPSQGFTVGGSAGDSKSFTVVDSLEKAASRASFFDRATIPNWSASGTPWEREALAARDNESARAKTSDGQSSFREYTVRGPAVVDFWWKVSSEQGYDTFSYAVNGVNQQTISGEVNWTYRTLTLPEGTHTVRWTYSKDESGAVGQDAGWLDDFAVYPATATLQVRDGSTTLTDNAQVSFGSGGGQNALTKTLTFQNSGYVPLEVELSLPGDSPFSFADGSREYLLLLGREDSSNVSLVLPVSSAGQKLATLSISAPDSTLPPPSIQLTGTVVGGEILVAQGGSQITSGQPSPVDLGIAPREMEFTITNNGNVADLTISQLSATGNFQITQQPATTVAVGGSTTFKVLALDSQQGAQLGTISIASNDEDTPVFTIPVTSRALLGLGVGVTTDSTFTSGQGGGVGWDFASTSLPNGTTGSALKTGATPHNGQSQLQATFTGAGLLSWKWKVATQENFDWLACEINGREVLAVSTKNAAWREQVVYVPNNGVVKWLYRKDGSGTIGEDAGYLADIAFERFTVPQVSYSNWWASFGRPTPPAATSPLARVGLPSVMSWVGGFNPNTGPATNHYRPIIEGGQLKLIYPVSRKYSGGSVTAEYSSDLSSGWSGAGLMQRLHSQDADTVIIEATPPAGAEKGFMRLNVR